ncbi:MAG: molecular chaperone HtpG [Treponemataceae bacterium]
MATYEFQTEVNQLLKLIIHSMYSNKDIFLREIISNASDALDKLKYLNLSDDAYKSINFDPRIDISFDEKEHILVVQDTGIGMSEQDLNNNLGTIARSGTKAFMEALENEAKKDSALIGQFGVGFYSAFMASSKIEVITRKASSDKLYRWVSNGTNNYEIEELALDSEVSRKYGFEDSSKNGSAVVMYLNEESTEYASRWKIESLIKKYSDHIAFPIFLHYTQNKYDDKGNVTETESKIDKVNSASALWKRSKTELKVEDYNDFYKTISHDSGDPLMYIHTNAEGTQEYTTLFYVPETAPFDMYQADYASGVKLYVKRVFITDDDKELLPSYLRFIRGVIDSEDLPLNVSREILQQNRILTSIKTQSVKKLLGEFKKMGEKADKAYEIAESERTDEQKEAISKWVKFINQYNRPLKEGLYSDFSNKDEIAEIIRFKSTAEQGTGDDRWTSFASYVQRMKADQKAIYYITGGDEKNLRASPLLEAYKAKGFEVLIMGDDLDDIVIPSLNNYKEFELKAVNRAGSDEELGINKEEAEKKAKEMKPVVEKIKAALGDKVKDVVLSKRLSDSPCCIVVDEKDPTFQMERMMRAMGQNIPGNVKAILEINGDHAIIKKIAASEDSEYISNVAHVLLDQSLLVGGAELSDPAEFVKRMNKLISM